MSVLDDIKTKSSTKDSIKSKDIQKTPNITKEQLNKGKSPMDILKNNDKQGGNTKVDSKDVNKAKEELFGNKDILKAKNDKELEKDKRVRKTAVGKTGEGIPLERVKLDVLKQIHPDDKGTYGYLPKEGTAYHNPKYDFTDVDWAKDMQNVRKDYLEESKQLEIAIERMNSEGFSKEDIAKYVVDARNQQKVTARANMKAEQLTGIEERNIKKYGNPIGPTAEGMFNKSKKELLKEGIYINDNEIWEIIIKKSMVKDDVINTLLGLIH